MGFDPSTIADQDFVLAYLSEHLDGDLPDDIKPRFEEMLKQPGQDEIPEHFQKMRGRLQLALQSCYLREEEKSELHALLQDPEEMERQEAAQAEAIARSESRSVLIRKVILGSLLAALVGFLAYIFVPDNSVEFKPLEYLGYEAVAMEEDPDGRLELATNKIEDIKQYLASYPGLGFKAQVLKPFSGWTPEGTTVADYETAKVAVVQYGKSDSGEKLFHFNYKGTLGELPKSDPGNLRGLVYQAYANDEVNIVAWQHTEDTVSFIVGRLGAVELAEIAVKAK